MYFHTYEGKIINKTTNTVLISTIILLTFFTEIALSKRGGDEDRSEFYGIIQARPLNGLQGEWTIGKRIFIADQNTEFDETEGPLIVGNCAKVHIRNGRIHEIDSEPMQDCQ